MRGDLARVVSRPAAAHGHVVVTAPRGLALAAVLVALALAGCAGSAGKEQTEATSSSTAAEGATGCDSEGPASLEAAACQSSGVDSLDPKYSRDFVPPKVDSSQCTGSTNLVFYAADDWIRLAQKLAEDAYPCAEYYISVPPDKDGSGNYTVPRPGEVERLHALGDRFHAMAEIRVQAWQQWLEQNPGKSWFDAGVEARKRMRASGYDPAHGDTWAVNELPLEILSNSELESEMRELVRGLHDGGQEPDVKGLVYSVTLPQTESNLGAYKDELEQLLVDEGFWQEMNRSVSFWAEEVYASPENCCVGETEATARADHLNEYLQHRLLLVRRGPAQVATALHFLREAYTPIANAAWAWANVYGRTTIPSAEMARFVSEQTFAIRRFEETALQDRLRGFGFAWAPVNSLGVDAAQFAADTSLVLERMARSIHDSYRRESALAACGPAGDALWCRCQVENAHFNDAWATFERWE
jgi:hypothetical protein